MLPVNLWSNSYYTPVSTPSTTTDPGGQFTAPFSGVDTTVWLYNPSQNQIDVNFAYRTTAGVFTLETLHVPGGGPNSITGGYLKQIIPDGSGAHFYTSDPDGAGPQSAPNFYAISTTNSGSAAISTSPEAVSYRGNQTWDWGFDLVPESSLTTQVLIGLGLGRAPTAPYTALELSQGKENGMPAWVTPIGNGDTPVIIYRILI